MQYGITANRMTLNRTRKRLGMARRGHTLMKHKLEELMRLFQEELERAIALQEEVQARLQEVYRRFVLGQGRLRVTDGSGVAGGAVVRTSIEFSTEHILNLRVPVIDVTAEMERPPYGLLETTADMDVAVIELREVLPRLFRLAQARRRIELLITELETTRRRVNALEFVLIPRLEDQARYIQMKLDEIERANVSRLMRIKSIIRSEG